MQAHGHQRRGFGTHQFFSKDGTLGDAPAGPAMLFRPVGGCPTLVIEDFLPGHGFLHRCEHRGHHLACFPNFGGQTFFKKGPHLFPKCLFLLRHTQIHTVLRCYQNQWYTVYTSTYETLMTGRIRALAKTVMRNFVAFTGGSRQLLPFSKAGQEPI